MTNTVSSPDRLPRRLSLVNAIDGLTIRWRWFTWDVLLLWVFVAFWDGMTALFVKGIAQTAGSWSPWYQLANGPQLVLGTAFTYWVLSLCLNHTDVRCAAGRIDVVNGPLPWPGNRRVASSEVADVYLLKVPGGDGPTTYRVAYEDRAGLERFFLKGLPRLDQAEYLASALRSKLGFRSPLPPTRLARPQLLLHPWQPQPRQF